MSKNTELRMTAKCKMKCTLSEKVGRAVKRARHNRTARPWAETRAKRGRLKWMR